MENIKKFFSDLKSFLTSVAQDPDVPSTDKKILLGLIVLVISPIDLIPDWIPVLGLLDDFIIVGIILDYFFEVLDSRILLKHYPWDMKSFATLRKFARIVTLIVPNVLKRKIWSYKKDIY